MLRQSGCGWILLLVLVALVVPTAALRFAVIKHDCFVEEVEFEGDSVSFSFVVLEHQSAWSEQHPGLSFSVLGPENNPVYEVHHRTEDKNLFRAVRKGPYRFCFTNHAPAPKTVVFQVRVGHVPTAEDVAKSEHFDPLATQIGKLKEAMAMIETEQRYLRAREVRHRLTGESTQRRLIFYAVAETMGVVGASLCQVYFFRRLFEKRGRRVSV